MSALTNIWRLKNLNYFPLYITGFDIMENVTLLGLNKIELLNVHANFTKCILYIEISH